jgi:hypothetical protein
MWRLKRFGLITAGFGLLAISVVVSCSHSGLGVSGASSEVHLSQAKPELIPTAADSSAGHSSARLASAGLTSTRDFGDSDIVPAGTLLTVQLENALSAGAPEARGAFDAVVAEPVVIQGVTVIPEGASVVGRIEAARASALKRSRAYVRLTLASIEVGGRDLAVQTSSLFARGRSDETSVLENASSVGSARSISLVNAVHLNKGRQLTFRLIGPVAVPGERAVARR